MRYILSMLILLFSLSFFTIACGGDDTTGSGDKACSVTNTTGECPDGKTCNNGVCIDNTCTPDCAGKVCGNDGCGGVCGTCNTGETCNANGTCETNTNNECSATNPTGTCPAGQTCNNGVCENETCTPDCNGKVCGDDGCGGTCGSCNANEHCTASGTCETGTCTPDCAGKVCGDDGCGGVCGTCNANETCNANGQCEAGCIPNCAGKACGDNGCGGTCGTCNAGETCNSNGTCSAATGNGELGGNCDQNNPCNDNTNLCLGAEGQQAHCYQPCNGEGDTSCTQTGYTCQDTQNANIGWICLPGNEPGNAQPGESCSAENNCVATAMCLSTDGGTTNTCYEKCTGATDTCSQGGNYKCVDTQNESIGWICMEQAAPGNAQPGESCSAENNCVDTAMCLSTDGGTTNTCYEKCTGENDTCSQGDNYKCVDTQNANIGWICMEQAAPGNAQPGESCSAENNCVDTAMCLSTDGGVTNTCYENCTGPNDTCSQGSNYKCIDTGNANIGWICWEQPAAGTTPIGGDCSQENCVEGATCLTTQGDNPVSTCYEDCDNNNGGTCSTSGYTCQAISSGDTFCFPQQ